jgi:hypothetical protein
MPAIAYIGYGLLILYGLYCFVFCCVVCITLIQENYFSILRYTPLRQEDNDTENPTHFEFVNEHKLETIYEY